MKIPLGAVALAVLLALGTTAFAADDATHKPIRAGIIGLDTSHVVAFTKIFNSPGETGDIADVRIVAAFPAGSPDIKESSERVEGFTKQVKAMDVEIVDSIPALLSKVDAVLLESVDGRPHLEQVRPVIEAGKPVFIDKPLAGSLAMRSQFPNSPKSTMFPGSPHPPFASAPALPKPRPTPNSATLLAAMPGAPATSNRIIPIFTGTASTAANCSTPTWAPAANR